MMAEPLDWLAYARTGKEFAVMDDLADLGIAHWRGERIEFERRGKNRTAEPYRYPALPNYIWIRPLPQQVHSLASIEFMARTFHFLSAHSAREMERFRRMAEARKLEAERIIGNRDAIAEYQAGQKLEISDGPFAGELATFCRIVHRSGELFPKIKAEMSLMGALVPIELDPLSVRKAVGS